MEGNYNCGCGFTERFLIIPLREMEGNYNVSRMLLLNPLNYTLERDGRELQLRLRLYRAFLDYTLERDGRELQR